MSWTADTPTQGTPGATTNPWVLSHTVSANARLLVVVLFVNGTTARTGAGVPAVVRRGDERESSRYLIGNHCGI